MTEINFPWLAAKPALEKSLEWQIGATAIFSVLAIATLIYAIQIARREQSKMPVFIWFGGALASLYEPLGDLLVHVTYHEVNQLTAFSAFTFKIPTWLTPSYTVVVSASAIWTMQRIKQGVTFKNWMLSFFLLIPVGVLFELPLIYMGAIEYFGPQAYPIFGYPLPMAFANTAGLILVNGSLLYFISQSTFGQRWPALFTLIVPMTTAGCHLGIALPWGLAMNSTDNLTVIYIMATVSMALAVLAAWVSGKMVCRD